MNPRNVIVLKNGVKVVMQFYMLGVPTKLKYSLKIVYILARNYCLDGKILSLQGICRNYFVHYCDHVVAMVTV